MSTWVRGEAQSEPQIEPTRGGAYRGSQLWVCSLLSSGFFSSRRSVSHLLKLSLLRSNSEAFYVMGDRDDRDFLHLGSLHLSG